MSQAALQEPFALGDLVLPNNVLYAPLAGCSDYPFRKMSSKGGAGLVYCEMVKMDALVRYDVNTFHLLDFDHTMPFIGAQLCGSNPKIAGKAAKILEELGFSVIDLNCGCPVDKVTKDGSGSGLLKNPDLIGDILCNIIAAVKIPVTVKIRAGWDEEEIQAPRITKIAEQAGAKAICVHARTRKQAYKGPARWEYIKASKEAAKTIKVIGNGDLHTGADVERMYRETGCDAFLIARGTLGAPWAAEEIIRYLKGDTPNRGFEERLEALREHYSYIRSYRNDKKAIVDMRRVGCWYIKRGRAAKMFRQRISHASSLEEVEELLYRYPWSQDDFHEDESCVETDEVCHCEG